jgi:lauroyl/myristoyl acyltransferase
MGDRCGADGPVWNWAAALARRTGAIVLPAVMVRLAPGRYAACFEAPLTAEACAGGAHRAAIRRQLARHPGQWCGFEAAPGGLL